MSEARVCKKCSMEKAIDEFRLEKKGTIKEWRQTLCRICENIDRAQKSREYRKTDGYRNNAKKYYSTPEYRERRKINRKRAHEALSNEAKEKLLERKRLIVSSAPIWHVKQLLGIKKGQHVPDELVFVKKLSLEIKRLIWSKQ